MDLPKSGTSRLGPFPKNLSKTNVNLDREYDGATGFFLPAYEILEILLGQVLYFPRLSRGSRWAIRICLFGKIRLVWLRGNKLATILCKIRSFFSGKSRFLKWLLDFIDELSLIGPREFIIAFRAWFL